MLLHNIIKDERDGKWKLVDPGGFLSSEKAPFYNYSQMMDANKQDTHQRHLSLLAQLKIHLRNVVEISEGSEKARLKRALKVPVFTDAERVHPLWAAIFYAHSDLFLNSELLLQVFGSLVYGIDERTMKNFLSSENTDPQSLEILKDILHFKNIGSSKTQENLSLLTDIPAKIILKHTGIQELRTVETMMSDYYAQVAGKAPKPGAIGAQIKSQTKCLGPLGKLSDARDDEL